MATAHHDRKRRRHRALLAALFLAGSSSGLAAQENFKGLNTWMLRSLPDSAKYVQELGPGSVRVDLPWQQIEPSPGMLDWRQLDQVMQTARASHVEVLLTLRSISSWGTKVPAQAADLYHHASLPKSMADWERFVHALASRYKGQGVSYEIENEVNSHFWGGSRDDYLQLLPASYRAIKSEDGDARVLASAMACGILFDLRDEAAQKTFRQTSDDWLSAVLATRAYDVINVHDYYFPSGAPVNGWTFTSYLDHTRELMARAGVSDLPIWITETGYVSRVVPTGGRRDPGSPDMQASWLTQAYRQATAFGAQRVFWLFLRDAAGAGYFGAMGLMDAQSRPRSAWRAYQDIGKP